MEQTQFSTIIGDLQLQVSIKDSDGLYLHAQHLQDSRQFHLELSNPVITQLMNHLFTMAQDAADNISPDIKLSFDKSIRLTYCAGTSHETKSFSLNHIEEISTKPVVSLENKVETLEKELEKLKAQYKEELANMRLEYEERIAKLQKIISQEQEIDLKEIEESSAIQEKEGNQEAMNDQLAAGQICFRRDTPSAENFDFSDKDKTAKLCAWNERDETRILECYPKVPKTGKYTFSLKVNEFACFVCFGISTKESGEIYQTGPGSYFYFVPYGILLGEELNIDDNIEGAGGKDSIVEMTVDMDARVLVFNVDGKQVRSCKLKEGEEEYTVFVFFGGFGACVTLL